MNEFDPTAYAKGYAWATSLIDTYGAPLVRQMTAQQGTGDYQLGFVTCLGVNIERQLQS